MRANALAQEGVRLVIVARGAEALETTASALRRDTGVEVVAIADDITTKAGRERALAASGELKFDTAGQFDIVVTNAGGPPAGDFRDWDTETWMRALNANMISPIELIRSTVDGMIARKWGRVVNITSTAVKAPSSYYGAEYPPGWRRISRDVLKRELIPAHHPRPTLRRSM